MTTYDAFNPTSLFAGGDDYVHRDITVASGSQLASGAIVNNAATTAALTVLPRGTVLGRVTATDKYIVCVKTAADGSQTPAAILAADNVDPSAGDVGAPAYFEGEFAGEMLAYDASWTLTTLEAAFRQADEPVYIRSVGVLG